MTNVNRNTIKRIKKDLVQSDDRFKNLREKFQAINSQKVSQKQYMNS